MRRLRFGTALALTILIITAGLATAASSYRSGHDPSASRLVYSQGANLAMMNLDGTGRRIIASGKTKDTFSWYSWSHDGLYLLVSRNVPGGGSSRLLLYDQEGRLLRTLVRQAPWSGFYPSWATNADRIAYVAGPCGSATLARSHCAHSTDQAVYSVDVDGKSQFLASYTTQQAGCGGGMLDPAGDLYRVETDFGVTMQPLVWTQGQPLVILKVLGLTTQSRPQHAGKVVQRPTQIALSRSDAMAGVVQRCTTNGCTPFVSLLDSRSGALLRTVGAGEMPAWSRDGRSLYFVRRSVQRQLQFRDASHNVVPSQINLTSIWRADSNGSHPVKLMSERAFGFGPLSVSPDGKSLIFSRIGDDGKLWSHRLPGNRYNTRLLQIYGPTVTVQQLDIKTGTETVLASAGRPTIQP